MTTKERIREVSEMLDEKLHEGSIGYIDYRDISDALDDIYIDLVESERKTNIPDGYITLEWLKQIDGNRPLFLFALCDDGSEIKDWAMISFDDDTNPEGCALIDCIRNEEKMYGHIRDYRKTWFCYMEDPFMEI